ncbi:MAG: hypothetical protein J6U70_02340 [Bacteroidales bacterium]|nr:hypothetical protein [Bacteroidales bacterium]
MKNLIYLLLALPLLFTSCSNEDMATSEESVQVSFCAEIPKPMGTRASSTLSVDKVYCAVFENGVEITNLRQNIDIVESQSIIFAPRLIKGRTYDVVFWAMKEGSYNVDNLSQIYRVEGKPEVDYDAFTATTNITVESSEIIAVTLTRPLAQLNIGVTEEDWNAVVALGQTPASTSISYESYDAFNALTGGLTRNYRSITRTAPASGTFDVGSTTYKSLGSFYVFVDGTTEKSLSDIEFTIKDGSGKDIRSDVQIVHVPIQRNYKTNIVGGLLTGSITYNISLGEFADQDKNQTL